MGQSGQAAGHAGGAAGAPEAGGGLAVRPFEGRDFEHVVGLYPPEWRFEGASPEEDALQARMDCASLLAACNLRLVAETAPGEGETGAGGRAGAEGDAQAGGNAEGGPEVAAVLLARSPALPALPDGEARAWEGVTERCRAGLEACASPVSRRMLAYIDQLEDRARLLVEAAGEARGPDNELVLFVSGPRARGRGAGRALAARLEGALRAAGQPSYWLQTDSRCTWQWYARHGYERVADVELTRGYPMPDARVPGLPDASLAAPRVFMYRKDIPAR